MNVKISEGNIKLGKIPNVSLPPVLACGNSSACASICYALQAYKQYPAVKKAWLNNYYLATKNRVRYFYDIAEYIKHNQPKYFRWHTSGDILDQEYLDCMIEIAIQYPKTKYLCFTKMFNFNYHNVPKNLAVKFSVFPSMAIPKTKLSIAWMQDGTEKRISKSAIKCSESCANCKSCWNSKRDVIFLKH